MKQCQINDENAFPDILQMSIQEKIKQCEPVMRQLQNEAYYKNEQLSLAGKYLDTLNKYSADMKANKTKR